MEPATEPKPKSFYYHFNKPKSQQIGKICMSVHFNKTCYFTEHVVCEVPCRTKHNKRQPLLVMAGKCREVVVEGNTITIR